MNFDKVSNSLLKLAWQFGIQYGTQFFMKLQKLVVMATNYVNIAFD